MQSTNHICLFGKKLFDTMKVLCFTDGLSSGGAERQLIGLSHYLQLRGYDVELLSYVKRDFYEDLIRDKGLRHMCLDVKGGKIRKFFAVLKYINKGKYDYVIAFKPGATFSTCIMKAFGRINHLIVSERNTNTRKSVRDDIKFFLYRFADHIVPNSYAQEAFIKQNYPALSSKITTITNFTDTDYFKPIKSVQDAGGQLNMLVVAKISPQKNILRFLDVVKQLKANRVPISIKWFGSVSGKENAYENECYKKWHEYQLEDYISFLPATRKILEEYQTCDVFCLPSIYEGYPNVVCEAMSCGKPILCSRVCDNPLIVEEGVNGSMFDPNDIDDMYNSIVSFVKLPDGLKKEMGQNSRKIALENFSPTAFVEKYIKLLDNNAQTF